MNPCASFVLLLALGALAGGASKPPAPTTPIKHVIMIQFENRSFDHALGWLKQTFNSAIDGLTGTESNPLRADKPNGPRVTVSPDAPYVATSSPGHAVETTAFQIYGTKHPGPGDKASMEGFVDDFSNRAPPGGEVMQVFDETRLPILNTLAKEFAVFDRFFCDLPGPTYPNRLFSVSGTSWGFTRNDRWQTLIGFPQKTIYESLENAGYSWRNYYQLVPSSAILARTRAERSLKNLSPYSAFLEDARVGILPTFGFIDPRYFPVGGVQNDQHPSGSHVLEGERLLKEVYEALRASPQWNETMLIITYDEHGGYYDHVAPPENVPHPGDDKPGWPDAFDFTRLGVRVPFVVVSPYTQKGTLVHRPSRAQQAAGVAEFNSSSEFSASSVPGTIKEMFGLPQFLTKRDAWAGKFHGQVLNRRSPRSDAPLTLPEVPEVDAAVLESFKHRRPTGFQEQLARLMATLNGKQALRLLEDEVASMTAEDAGHFALEQWAAFVEHQEKSASAAAAA